MAISADLHTFTVTNADAVNTTYTRSGLSFTPQVLIAWTCGRADTSDAVGLRSIYRAYGFGVSTASRFGVGTSSQHNQNTSVTAHSQTNTRILTVPAFDGASVVYLIDIDDMSSGQWRLILDAISSPAISIRVSVLALAGFDAVECGQFTEPGSTGTQTVTLANGSLTPSIVLVSGVSQGSAAAVGAHAQMMIGASDGTRQGVWFGSALDNQGNSDTYGYAESTNAIATSTIAGTVLTARATISNFAAGSFDVGWAEVNAVGNRIYNYLAIQAGSGNNVRVDNFLTQTDTSTAITESGYGFQPVALLVVSACRAESTADVLTADDRLSIGAALSASTRVAQGCSDDDSNNFTVCNSIIEYDAFYANATSGAGTIDGLGDLTSMDSEGFSAIMDDADPAQAFCFLISLGNAAATAKSASDALAVALSEGSSGLSVVVRTSDTFAVRVAEQASLAASVQAALEELGIGVEERSAVQALLSTVDLIAAGLYEAPSALSVMLRAEDLAALGIEDSGGPITVSVLSSEVLEIGMQEAAALLAFVSASETLGITLEDLASVIELMATIQKSASDSLAIGIDDLTAALRVLTDTSDPLGVGMTELAELFARVTGLDDLPVTVDERAALAVVLSAADSLGLTLEELVAIAVTFQSDDVLAVGLSDLGTVLELIAAIAKSASDVVAISLEELSAVAAHLQQTDTLGVTLSEQLSLAVTLQALDDLGISVDEVARLSAFLVSEDVLSVATGELTQILLPILVNDELRVALFEAVSIQEVEIVGLGPVLITTLQSLMPVRSLVSLTPVRTMELA